MIFLLNFTGALHKITCHHFLQQNWKFLIWISSQIFDGHNGISAAIFAKENLLDNVLSAIPQGISRDEWLQALPRALVAGFVKTDIEFQQKGVSSSFTPMRRNFILCSYTKTFKMMTGETSGTTVTFVVVDGWTITVASVGDSRCILDTQGGVVSLLTVDHRLEENAEERERVTASGGEVGRLNVFGGNEVHSSLMLLDSEYYFV